MTPLLASSRAANPEPFFALKSPVPAARGADSALAAFSAKPTLDVSLSMDEEARACNAALKTAFGLGEKGEEAFARRANHNANKSGDELAQNLAQSRLAAFGPPPDIPRASLGLEIEAPWSAYFPHLWRQFGLAERSIGRLSPEELRELTRLCALDEAILLPRLRRAVECGVPRGNDRYWEFALRPARDPGLLAEQIGLLTQAGLLPRTRPLSLQITMGELRASEDAQELALALSAFCVDARRWRRGIEQTRSAIHTGWARKGSGGVHEKEASELSHSAAFACEIRPLLLPVDPAQSAFLLELASRGATAILSAQNPNARAKRWSAGERAWARFREAAAAARRAENCPPLAALRWEKGAVPDYAAWELFCDRFDALAPRLRAAAADAWLSPEREDAKRWAQSLNSLDWARGVEP